VRLLLDQFGILDRGGVALETQKTTDFQETELNKRAFGLQEVSTFVGVHTGLKAIV